MEPESPEEHSLQATKAWWRRLQLIILSGGVLLLLAALYFILIYNGYDLIYSDQIRPWMEGRERMGSNINPAGATNTRGFFVVYWLAIPGAVITLIGILMFWPAVLHEKITKGW